MIRIIEKSAGRTFYNLHRKKTIPLQSKKFLALLFSILTIAFGLNMLPSSVKAATLAGNDVTVLAFTSDVHNKSDNIAANRQSGWIDKVIQKYGRIDAMGFCGDMGNGRATESDFWDFTRSVMDITDQKGITDVYTTGNHEFKNGNYSGTSNPVAKNFIVDAEGLAGVN